MPMKSPNEEVFRLGNMKRKARKEREVRTDLESSRESGSHKKSTRVVQSTANQKN